MITKMLEHEPDLYTRLFHRLSGYQFLVDTHDRRRPGGFRHGVDCEIFYILHRRVLFFYLCAHFAEQSRQLSFVNCKCSTLFNSGY